jgi:hypothetical protein
MSELAKAKRAAATYLRVLAMVLCFCFASASIAMLVHAQSTVAERTARLEVMGITSDARLARLESDLSHLQSEVATMNGIGIGVGTALGLLQVLQMVLGRKVV